MRLIDIVTLVAAALNIGIGFFVLTRNYKRPLYQSFSAFSFVTGFWVLSNFLFSVFPSRFLIESQYSFGSVVIPISFIWFITFLDGKIPKRTTILLTVLAVVLFLPPYINSTVIQSFEILGEHSYSLVLSDFFDYYSLIPITFFIYLIFKIVSSYRKEQGIKKLQIKYILAGALGFGGISILVSFILPYFKISIVAPFDAQSSLIFVAFSLYAIIRHRLLDIRFVLTRSIVYGFLLTVVALLFTFITFLSAQFFGGTSNSRVVVSIIAAALIVFGLEPFKRLLSRATDRVFFKAKVDYQRLLRDISEVLSVQINRDQLIRAIRVKLKEGLKVKLVATLVRQTGEGADNQFVALQDLLAEHPNLVIADTSPLVQYIRDRKRPSLIESLERKIEDTPEDKRKPLEASRAEFERLGVALAAPIFAQNNLVAILLLGPKLSGDSFTNDDLQLIEVLSPQIGSAIQKANLFEQVRKFGENLKIRVQEATEELKERNVSLVTLQHITKDITQTLDFTKVSQEIADAVATELGFVGAILVFFDDDGVTLRARAITNTPLTAKAISMLPHGFMDYSSRIDDPEHTNLGHEVIRTGEVKFAERFSDVISPPVPKLLADTLQKLLRVKTFVLVPIMSEGRAIGAIEVAARRRQDEVSTQEIETIKSMADQLGIVARNIRLFGQIQKANQELEVANRHLQVLDQAKSEFVSIASHQLRTPMTGIMGYLSMLVEGDFGRIDPKHLDILKSLLDESQRMIRLINLFLNVSKIEAGKFTITRRDTRLEEVIEREIREVKKSADDKGLVLSFTKPKTALPVLSVDTDKIQDVLLNLIDNAIKYTAKGSITLSAEKDDGGITVHVADTGIGIKKEDIRELFNKFVRAKGIAQIHPDGSGLGLFIAKSIVEGHGGHIWVESEGEGKGSTFSFWLPNVVREKGGAA